MVDWTSFPDKSYGATGRVSCISPDLNIYWNQTWGFRVFYVFLFLSYLYHNFWVHSYFRWIFYYYCSLRISISICTSCIILSDKYHGDNEVVHLIHLEFCNNLISIEMRYCQAFKIYRIIKYLKNCNYSWECSHFWIQTINIQIRKRDNLIHLHVTVILLN